MNSQKVLLVDLDGTLLNTNTFHKYIYFIARHYSKTNILKALYILFFTFFRLIKIISHSQLKYKLLKVSEDLPGESAFSFGQSLLKYKNERVLDIMINYDGLKILASAAPEKYAKTVGESFRFDKTLSTKCPGEGRWVENIRENKKRALENFMATRSAGYVLDVLVTDHHDDLPLMEVFNRVVLINPSQETLAKTRHLKRKISITTSRID